LDVKNQKCLHILCFYGRQIGVCTWLSTSRRYLGEHIASPFISPAFDAGVCFVCCFRISSGCVFLFRARVVRLAFIFFFIFRRLTIGSHVVHCPACHAVINYIPSKERKLLFILHFGRILAADFFSESIFSRHFYLFSKKSHPKICISRKKVVPLHCVQREVCY
jgi:hypothetical protein